MPEKKYTQDDVERIVNARVQEHVQRIQDDRFKEEFTELKEVVGNLDARLEKSNNCGEKILEKLSTYDRYVDGFGLSQFTPELMAAVLPNVQQFVDNRRIRRFIFLAIGSPIVASVVTIAANIWGQHR